MRHLALHENQIGRWPEIFELSQLKVLHLAKNGIEEIPEAITRLKALQTLILSDNRITTIPPGIISLPLLKHLDVSGNPISAPQPEIVAGGTAAIQEYFWALTETPATQLFEAKLIIVGAGEVGKTCLARKLVDPIYDIEKNKQAIETTRGIDIKEWHIETDIAKDFKVNLWDFGGQEIYHATHQFFLTKRTLYLFVWDARREDHIQGMDYWLSIVKLLSDSSPVLMILNKSDVRIKEVDQKSLRGKFENILGFYKVSALTGQGILELSRDVRMHIARLPHVGDEWPAKWSNIRSALERENRNYISIEEYLTMCQQEGLSTAQAETLSFYLHNLGVVLHFREDHILQKILILKPEWGTNAVYAVLDTKTIQENNGRFSFKDLTTIWGHTIYPRSCHTELLQLMKKFELCFQLGESDEYIAPELLSETQPRFPWNESNTLHFEYHYDFMPAGIISRFIARNHAQIESNFYWRNGVLLAWEGNRAVVLTEPLNRKIKVSVAGRHKKDILAVIRRDFELIHRTLNNLQVRQMIPCICEKCRSSRDAFLFEYQRLRGYQENRITEIPCEKSWMKISVAELITGVFYTEDFVSQPAPATSTGTGVHIEHIEHYHAGGGPMIIRESSQPQIRGPWFAGLFYLISLIILIVLLAVVAKQVPWWALPIVITGGLLGVTIVGALQLRQDKGLSEQNFLKLMALAFRQLPLLKQALSADAKPEAK